MAKITSLLERCHRCDSFEFHHQGRTFVRATDYTLSQSLPTDQPQRATHLSEDDESTLLSSIRSLFELDPISLLLVQHVFHGEKLAKFGENLNAIAAKIGRYRGGKASRAVSYARRDAILSKFPQFAALLEAR